MREQVLITGGAGSLGRAFIGLLHQDHDLTIIDNSEWAIAELRKEYPNINCILGDFADWRFAENPASMLIHLAAYKHVEIGEENVEAFISNNIYKTQILFNEASRFGTDILFVSTDKAVEPCSLYGYTKAIGERLSRCYGGSVARLGNILSSSGSVIPVWEKAIERGAPVPITDERMVRYFIEDFEAANYIWHEFLKGEKLIIPPCQEIRMLDLLAMVLKRHGYKKVQDYKPGVHIIGMRPGEKLKEKLKWEEE